MKPRIPWHARPHPVLLLLISLVATWLPAQLLGVGISPCFLFLGSIFIAIVADRLSRLFQKPYRIEAAAVIFVLIMSSSVSYWTANPSADHLFRTAFGIPPPAGVKNTVGRAQWFDGLILVLRFDADATALGELLQHRGFVREPLLTAPGVTGIDLTQVRTHFSVSQIIDAQWNRTITGSSGELWRWDGYDTNPFGTILFVNEKGEVWVVYANGG